MRDHRPHASKMQASKRPDPGFQVPKPARQSLFRSTFCSTGSSKPCAKGFQFDFLRDKELKTVRRGLD